MSGGRNSLPHIMSDVKRAVLEQFPERGQWICAFLDLHLQPDAIRFKRGDGWSRHYPRSFCTDAKDRLQRIVVVPIQERTSAILASLQNPTPAQASLRTMTFRLVESSPDPFYEEI